MRVTVVTNRGYKVFDDIRHIMEYKDEIILYGAHLTNINIDKTDDTRIFIYWEV